MQASTVLRERSLNQLYMLAIMACIQPAEVEQLYDGDLPMSGRGVKKIAKAGGTEGVDA